MILVSPRAAALRILAARAELSRAPPESTFALADFQRDGVARAAEILRQRGGVIIADAVGLGKTFIAAALIEHALVVGNVVVIVPAALRPAWLRTLLPLRRTADPARLCVTTHGRLSRGRTPALDPHLVVVDEAHAFRNPATRRYRTLRLFCSRAQVALLTATPVNNSMADLYYQLRLFARDDAFRDLGIGSLDALLRQSEPDARSIEHLRNAVMIRRSRADVRSRYPVMTLPTGAALRSPHEVALATVTYPPLVSASCVESLLKRTSFAAYEHEASRVLLALSLLKRIQSSRRAALLSVDRLIAFHERFLSALDRGRFVRPRSFSTGDQDQLWLEEIVLHEVPRHVDTARVRRCVIDDVRVLHDFRETLAAAADEKRRVLGDLLSTRAPPHRTIVFSEYRDTATFLAASLRSSFRIGLVTGDAGFIGTTRVGRMQAIRHFAPIANSAPAPPDSARIDVLIATDVLAEGLNLQDADAVVSYDLPWNPVRLIQRAGRIDRIGSQHGRVAVYNFLPDRDMDQFLGIVRRLRQKLGALRAAVGHESQILEAGELNDEVIASLVAGRAAVRGSDGTQAPTLEAEDLREMGPVGSISAFPGRPGRALVCFQSRIGLRELIWDGSPGLADKAGADRIIGESLIQEGISAAPGLAAIIATCHAYMRSLARLPGNTAEVGTLAGIIQCSVMAYGIEAAPQLLDLADATLADLPGCLDPGWARRRIEGARGVDGLFQALREVRDSCRSCATEPLEWRFVAAIAAD